MHWRLRSPLLAALVIAGGILTSGCVSDRVVERQDVAPIGVLYSVKFPGGEKGVVKIQFRLPDGTMHNARVTTPWGSDLLYFHPGDPVFIEATATGDFALTPLQCVAISEPDNREGTTFFGSRGGTCRAKGRAGRHLYP